MRHNTERRELEYYLNLRYPVTVHSDPESGFVAEIEELPGCMTQAETLDEIFKAIEDARQLWIKTAYDEGQNIPLPRDIEEYPGKFLVRIPKSLHRALTRAAKNEGVSLNQYVTSLLASGVYGDAMAAQINTILAQMGRTMWFPVAPFGVKESPLEYDEFIVIREEQLAGKQ